MTSGYSDAPKPISYKTGSGQAGVWLYIPYILTYPVPLRPIGGVGVLKCVNETLYLEKSIDAGKSKSSLLLISCLYGKDDVLLSPCKGIQHLMPYGQQTD